MFSIRNCLLCLLLFLPVKIVSFAENPKPSEIAKKAFPSVVMLVMQDQNGQPLSLGSGFFVKENIVATNLHVVEESVGGYAKLVGKKEKYPIKGYVAIDYRMDIILLEIEGIKAPIMDLNKSTLPEVGEEVFAIGNPKGLEGTFSTGIVSGIRLFESDNILQITAPISPGSSGGPVMNSEGKIIGIAVATFKGGQNLNFAIPVSYLSALMDNTKTPISLGEQREKRDKDKSVLSSYGNLNKDGVECNSFLWNHNYDNPYTRDQGFSFSVRNKTKGNIKDVVILVVFYDKDNLPLEFTFVVYESFIPSNLAKQVETSIGYNVKKLTTKYKDSDIFEDRPFTKVEYRVLNFNIDDKEDDLF